MRRVVTGGAAGHVRHHEHLPRPARPLRRAVRDGAHAGGRHRGAARARPPWCSTATTRWWRASPRSAAARRLYFGMVRRTSARHELPEHAADTIRCVRCQHPLTLPPACTSRTSGDYECRECGNRTAGPRHSRHRDPAVAGQRHPTSPSRRRRGPAPARAACQDCTTSTTRPPRSPAGRCRCRSRWSPARRGGARAACARRSDAWRRSRRATARWCCRVRQEPHVLQHHPPGGTAAARPQARPGRAQQHGGRRGGLRLALGRRPGAARAADWRPWSSAGRGPRRSRCASSTPGPTRRACG